MRFELRCSLKNQVVKLKSSQGEIERFVVADLGEILLVCRPEERDKAAAEGREPKAIGFRRRDIAGGNGVFYVKQERSGKSDDLVLGLPPLSPQGEAPTREPEPADEKGE